MFSHGKKPAPSSGSLRTQARTSRRSLRVCTQKLWVAYHSPRTVATLSGLVQTQAGCAPLRQSRLRSFTMSPTDRKQEGAFALPQGEFGLDVIALVGALRHAEHRSVPEIHRELSGGGWMSPSAR